MVEHLIEVTTTKLENSNNNNNKFILNFLNVKKFSKIACKKIRGGSIILINFFFFSNRDSLFRKSVLNPLARKMQNLASFSPLKKSYTFIILSVIT